MLPAEATMDPGSASDALHKVLLADDDPERRALLARALQSLTKATVIPIETSIALDSALRSPVSLVVTSARLDDTSSLQTLTRVRESGLATPFIVYSGLAAGLLRVLVSGQGNAVLSSRVMDLRTLADLVSVFLRSSAAR